MSIALGHGIGLPFQKTQAASGDVTPGGTNDVLLLKNGTDGLLLKDGTSFLKLASSS